MDQTISRRRMLGFGAALAGSSLFAQEVLAQSVVGFAEPPMKPVQVGAHCWYVQGLSAMGSPQNQNFISNAGFIVTSDSVVVVDALGAPALAERLLEAIATVTDKPVRTVILTHYHADHIYGLQVLKAAGAHIIADAAGREYLYAHAAEGRLEASRVELAPWINQDTRIVEADEWISGRQERTFGGVKLQLLPAGPAHTPEDLAVFVPSDGVLYSGDVVFANRIPYVGEADSRSWLDSLERLRGLNARVIVPGHGNASRDPQKDIDTTSRYLKYLRDSMRQAAEDLTPFEEAYAATDWSEFEKLPLFHEANHMNAYNTYLLMESQVK